MENASSGLRLPLPRVHLSRVGDEGLAHLVGNGRQRAFEAVYERYHQPLYRYCRSMLQSDADAQDALQSTFAAALGALQRGQRSAPLRPWLFRIAHNESISLLRRRRVQLEPGAHPQLSAASADEEAAGRARLALLVADLGELPERQRSALVMRELSGLSHADIAAALATTVGAAKQAIFDARSALSELTEGRAMPCEDVLRTISDRDGRALRGRRVRAHLRNCASCAAFAAAIDTRRSDLRALTPALPPAVSAVLLGRVAKSASGHLAAPSSGAVAAGAVGKVGATALVSKALAGVVVVVAAAGVAGLVKVLPHNSAASPVQTIPPAQFTRPPAAPAHDWQPGRSLRIGNRASASSRRAHSAQPLPAGVVANPAAATHAGSSHRGAANAIPARGSTVNPHGLARPHGSASHTLPASAKTPVAPVRPMHPIAPTPTSPPVVAHQIVPPAAPVGSGSVQSGLTGVSTHTH